MIAAALLFFMSLDGAAFFNQRVAPILKQNCLRCHNHELDDGDISFENRASLVANRPDHGPAVVPGEPEKSALVRAIRHTGEIQMPPGKKLDQRDIDTLIDWIRIGAPFGSAEQNKK